MKNILGRNDITDVLADTFIAQAFARIQRTLRVPAMERINEYTTVAGQFSLPIPSDFLNLKHLYSGSRALTFVPVGTMLGRSPGTGAPQNYTRIGAELRLWPTPPAGTKVSLVYHGEFPELDLDTDTNFVSDIAPDLLIYGALAYAADHFMDDRKQLFEDTFARTYAELEEQGRLTEMEQDGMAIQPPSDLEY